MKAQQVEFGSVCANGAGADKIPIARQVPRADDFDRNP
jgi:hypothetical protein